MNIISEPFRPVEKKIKQFNFKLYSSKMGKGKKERKRERTRGKEKGKGQEKGTKKEKGKGKGRWKKNCLRNVGRTNARTHTRTDTKVILYFVQCYALHRTDNNGRKHRQHLFCLPTNTWLG